jgi:ADP-ribose pyrophosphatase YjhB (NUDIX family)
MKKIIASGPVLIKNGKLIVIKDMKDPFYKIPGGRVEKGEDLEETCKREAFEELGIKIKIIKKLSTLNLTKNPRTNEKMGIELHHYLCEPEEGSFSKMKPGKDILDIKKFLVSEIKSGKHNVAPNIKFLIKKGDI